ncbi:signal transduction histidine kinase [Streptomyces sp. Ag109_G2-6]|uniref:sensor histidine kinase n=1 Tax=Streptomyces TaxID=1883 RepID=UPI0009A534BB|nr:MULTISPECIES: sensor histidine kinase [Streptomyces]RPF43617.1 signal transduction histidine kinase [Streptomyces sp. Ag109_G2-6]
MDLSTTRTYVSRSARAAGYCAIAAAHGLALVVLIPVLVYSAVLCLVGVGLLVLPLELRLLRRLADAERSRLGRWAATPTTPAGPHTRSTLRAVLSDPATGRDLRWAPCMAVAGTLLGLIGAVLFLFPAAVLVLVGLWWVFPADEPIKVMMNIPIDGWGSALRIGVPQFVLSVLLALTGPPLIARLAAASSRRLLAPSAAAVLAERVAALNRTRTGAITAHGDELRRIERDLHDGTQARLVSLAMQLGLAERTLGSDPEAVGPLLTRAREGAEEAMAELRDFLRSIYPPVLADRGLAGALSAVVARCPVPAAAHLGELGEVPAQVEVAVYFAVTEALTNAAKHSHARSASVTLARAGDTLRAEITDDGRGGAAEGHGTGLRGMRRRVEAVDGVLRVQSPPGGPTVITVECPCAS